MFQKRAFEYLQNDENNCGRSLKRSKIGHDEENKENAFFIPPPVSTRIRRGVVSDTSFERDQKKYVQLRLF